jgi:hypothetical protein
LKTPDGRVIEMVWVLIGLVRPSSYIYTSDNNIAELVGGIPTPQKNMSSSVGIIIPNIYIMEK